MSVDAIVFLNFFMALISVGLVIGVVVNER
jgi:hypothetical protein